MAGFTWLDYLIVAAYLAGVTVLGSLFASGQKSSRDFFLAGRGMSWFPMALSVIATDFSAISFLGAPGYVVAHDLVIDLQPLVFIWVLPISLYLFVRFFHRLELISAYEYLEKRFNLALRTGCSLLFICLRVSWMATALYATSLALTQATPLPFWLCAVLIGGLTTFYSSLGGMKAVIWTDVSQFFIFVTAIALVLVRAVGSLPGGVVMAWDTANRAGHTRLLNFEGGWEAITTPAVLIGGSFLVLISYGVDQVVIQRYLTARSVDEIKRSMVFQVCAAPGLLFMLAVIGLAVYSFYSHFPERIPEGLETDKWFPYFIVHELPMGFSGLVIAGLFAATMSSISSGVNSITAACVIDFYRRLLAGDSRVMQKQGDSPFGVGFRSAKPARNPDFSDPLGLLGRCSDRPGIRSRTHRRDCHYRQDTERLFRGCAVGGFLVGYPCSESERSWRSAGRADRFRHDLDGRLGDPDQLVLVCPHRLLDHGGCRNGCEPFLCAPFREANLRPYVECRLVDGPDNLGRKSRGHRLPLRDRVESQKQILCSHRQAPRPCGLRSRAGELTALAVARAGRLALLRAER